MGVRVRETTPEIRMATVMVTANSCSIRPSMPAMNSTGIKTATSEIVMEMIVKPISFEPAQAASMRRFAMLHVADDVLQHDDGVIDHETDRQGQGHQGDVVDRKTEGVHGRKGADDRERQGQTGDDRGREVAQEEEDHHDHQGDRQQQGELDIRHRFADRTRYGRRGYSDRPSRAAGCERRASAA